MSSKGTIKNLIPYKPGQSGNPTGKPKGTKDRATIYRDILASRAKALKLPKVKELMKALNAAEDITLGELIALKNSTMSLYTNALGLKASAHVEDSGHGKLTQNTVITGADGTPLAVNIETKTEMQHQVKGLSVEALKEIQDIIKKDKEKKAAEEEQIKTSAEAGAS